MSLNQSFLRRRKLLVGATAGSFAGMIPFANSSAQASGFPNRPITFICPWPAGGTSDVTMRVLAQVVSKELGKLWLSRIARALQA